MLSYRHAFHAGNHADVLKHFVLMQVLSYASEKDKPYWYIDTHAGAGKYSLNQGYATQNEEFSGGISQLWDADDVPTALSEYVALVKKINPDGHLRYYPGSPLVAEMLIRNEDRMRLFELHPSDSKILLQNFKQAGRKVMIETEDGFAGIKALLPPPSRRAVVLIDPPYEEKQDYQRVVTSIKESLQRFATGTYIIWYPLLQRPEPLQMLTQLAKLQLKSWLNVSLTVQSPSIEGFGMHGSGLFIINPPWTLPATLAEAMPYLQKKLGLDDSASFKLESQIP
ncbi:competence protein ComJ [Methylovorus sp. MM2]|uniref:23S rRNA (adenine(2030)-N(6))-methyltransferase RlmJ n=1 Tax=Methylovorus sp. MM2 TaxID=1848038 RepID=UPI0007E232DE|nr:23S rRNA (adenine(2030)-N(6))-methyltransferase RlmJ [Methylovorus sp. MM2]OAM52678.1 competence protein ComJ [Methylovorus sp. MM2]